MKLTAIAPSPTADAQRLTDPLRTSPAANTPGRLVSRKNGVRPCARQRSPRTASRGTARAGQDETLLVKLHAATQPFGVRIGPDEEEQRRRVDPRLDAGIVADADRLEMTVSFQRGHDGASVNLDVVDLLDAIHEVSRHALSQIPAARDDVHAPRISRQRHDGLPRRIAGAHDDDLLVATELRFRVRRGIVDAGTLELTQTRHIEPAILHTRRDKDATCRESSCRRRA